MRNSVRNREDIHAFRGEDDADNEAVATISLALRASRLDSVAMLDSL
jgi:hypothetical protein